MTRWVSGILPFFYSIPPAGPGPEDSSYEYIFSLISGDNAGGIFGVVRGNYQVFIAPVNSVNVAVLAAKPSKSEDSSRSRRDVIGINNDDIAGSDCGFHGVIISVNLDGQEVLIVAAAYSRR